MLSSFLLLSFSVSPTVTVALVYMLYAAPAVTAFILLAMLIVYGLYSVWVFKKWENEFFARQRLNRHNESCPSNAELPDIKA